AKALAHANQWPRDALILSLPLGAFGLFAFSGMADHDQARVDLCERHAAHFADDDWWFLTSYGWALAENGAVSRGRAMLEKALELRRRNANTVHALVHSMFEGGAGDDTQKLITEWLPSYDRGGVLHGHIAWHAAVVALERGDTDGAFQTYLDHVHPSVSKGMPINIVSDAASLLWRMDAYGHGAPEGRWQEIAAYAHKAFPRPGHAFVDTHMAMIEAATGAHAELGERVSALEAMATSGALGAGDVVPAIGRASLAFAGGDYATCVNILEPFAADVARIGGSGAQREVIEDTLLVALMRSGEAAKANALLDQRLHRRPSPRDARWKAQLSPAN
ncbi:MAG: tetratricopeptide repeat protein, partial [Caulobacteraceae bacterium]|nr:tetratricopeptide repeat protein [Caulobacteraceae bacterium]